VPEWSREAEYASRAVLLCLAEGPFQALDAATYARQARRLLVRPGLLGPGVAAGRNAVPWDRRLALEAAYAAAPRRIGTDLRLILGSLRVWLSGRGATAPGHASMPAFTRE
jgi:hypothetical protein